MDFLEAYQIMLTGGKIQRSGWAGYWYLDSVTGELVIHKGNGDELRNVSDNLRLTVDNTFAKDWCEYHGRQGYSVLGARKK